MPDLQSALATALRNKFDSWEQDEKETQLNHQPATQPKEETMQAATPAIKNANTTPGEKGFRTTTNVTRATFEYIKANPGLKPMKYVELLEKQGYKPGSTTSIVSQLITCGQAFRDASGGVHIAVPVYLPMSVKKGQKSVSAKALATLPATMRRKINIVVRKRKEEPQVPSKGIAALAPATTPAPVPVATPVATPAPALVVDTMMDAEILINHIGLKQAHALYQELGKYFKG